MRRALLLSLVAALGLGLWVWSPTADASEPPAMYIYDLKAWGDPALTFNVDIYVAGTNDLGGFEFELHYDDSIVSVVAVEEGPLLSSAGGDTVCASSTVVDGVATLACVLTGPPPPVKVDGHVGRVKLQFDYPFTGPLELFLMACDAVDSDGDAIALNGCKDTTVTVNAALPPVPMSMTPATTKLQAVAGSTFTVDVEVEDTTDFGAFEFAVEYDDALLNVSDIREGPFLSSGGGDTVCFEDLLTSGRARFACVVIGKYGPTGAGTVAHVDFTVKAPFSGSANLTLAACRAADNQGVPIPVHDCVGATLLSNPTPTPTSTPEPPPAPVGGMSRGVDAAGLQAGVSDSSRSGSAAWWAIAGGGFAAALVGAELVRRRRSGDKRCGVGIEKRLRR
jgi:hypothetical protein